MAFLSALTLPAVPGTYTYGEIGLHAAQCADPVIQLEEHNALVQDIRTLRTKLLQSVMERNPETRPRVPASIVVVGVVGRTGRCALHHVGPVLKSELKFVDVMRALVVHLKMTRALAKLGHVVPAVPGRGRTGLHVLLRVMDPVNVWSPACVREEFQMHQTVWERLALRLKGAGMKPCVRLLPTTLTIQPLRMHANGQTGAFGKTALQSVEEELSLDHVHANVWTLTEDNGPGIQKIVTALP